MTTKNVTNVKVVTTFCIIHSNEGGWGRQGARYIYIYIFVSIWYKSLYHDEHEIYMYVTGLLLDGH